jgi:hypothetical protein
VHNPVKLNHNKVRVRLLLGAKVDCTSRHSLEIDVVGLLGLLVEPWRSGDPREISSISMSTRSAPGRVGAVFTGLAEAMCTSWLLANTQSIGSW